MQMCLFDKTECVILLGYWILITKSNLLDPQKRLWWDWIFRFPSERRCLISNKKSNSCWMREIIATDMADDMK